MARPQRPADLRSAVETFSLCTSAQIKEMYKLGYTPGKQQIALIAGTLNAIQHMDRVYAFPGAAGSGKTTTLMLMVTVLHDCGIDLTVAAPTWKAAGRATEALEPVLGMIAQRRVVTVHSIFVAEVNEVMDEEAQGEAAEFADELQFAVSDKKKNVGRVLIVDESSMVGVETGRALEQVLTENVTIVAVGDLHQLPPVKDKPFFDLNNPLELTDVYRQDKGPVLTAVTKIREERAPFTWSREATNWKRGQQILRESGIETKWATPAETGKRLASALLRNNGDAAAIVGTHNSRVAVNDATRAALGMPDRKYGPQVGERLVFRQGTAGYRNADVVEVLSVRAYDFGDDFGPGWVLRVRNGHEAEVAVLASTWATQTPKFRGLLPMTVKKDMTRLMANDWIAFADEIQEEVNVRIEAWRARGAKGGRMRRKNMEFDPAKALPPRFLYQPGKVSKGGARDPDRGIWVAEAARKVGAWALYLNQFLGAVDTGYAITCHMAQGSQYKEILVVSDCVDFLSDGDKSIIYKWSYTALSRAIEKATVILKSKNGPTEGPGSWRPGAGASNGGYRRRAG